MDYCVQEPEVSREAVEIYSQMVGLLELVKAENERYDAAIESLSDTDLELRAELGRVRARDEMGLWVGDSVSILNGMIRKTSTPIVGGVIELVEATSLESSLRIVIANGEERMVLVWETR